MNFPLLVFFILSSLLCSTTGQETFIDPKVVFTHFEGWGTSLAWFGDILGGMRQEVIDEITSGLFSPDRLNLNIVRYVIGGTVPYDYTCGQYRSGGATETYKDGPDISYNWSRNPYQRKILQAAKDLGADTFEAFSNSPPQWMTISGCSKGNPGGGLIHVNFDPVNADAFADYATEVIKYFHENWGITFQSYAPFNEPSSGGWFGEAQSQEGCNMDRAGLVAVIRSVHAALQRKNMTYTTISVADETQINTEISSQNHFKDQGITNLYSKVNVHGYWDVGIVRRDMLYSITQRNGHTLWMDEMGWGSSPIGDMSSGLTIANRILLDIRTMLPSAWAYWQAMEDRGVWGLVDVPYLNATLENVRYNSGYYAMMQFSKYIKKGYNIVHVNDASALAAYNDPDKTLVLVIVNDGVDPKSVEYSLKLFSSFDDLLVTRTSTTELNANVPPGSFNSTLEKISYQAPPESVTTVVFKNAEAIVRQNLVRNGNFETIENENPSWTLCCGNGEDQSVIISDNNVRLGNFSGHLRTIIAENQTSLSQTIVAPEDRVYYLSAWVATTVSAKLGIKSEFNQGPEVIISPILGYKSYGLSFTAAAGDSITIYVSSTQNSNTYIDDVVLH